MQFSDLAGVVLLLQECAVTLAASQKALLSILFTLAQDEWPAVAQPCMAFLRSSPEASTSGQDQDGAKCAALRHAAPALLGAELVSGLCMDLLLGLGSSLQHGEQQGALHAQRLSTALQVDYIIASAACTHGLELLKSPEHSIHDKQASKSEDWHDGSPPSAAHRQSLMRIAQAQATPTTLTSCLLKDCRCIKCASNAA